MTKVYKWTDNVEVPMSGKYAIPQMVRIECSDETEKLYELESRRSDIIEKCAEEHGKVLGFTKEQYWTHSLPFQLLSILESYDRDLSVNVCRAFLNYFQK